MALNSYYTTKVTVAFDNKDKFWKTRYSFISSCYGWLNKVLTSFKKAEFVEPTNENDPHDIIHIHDQTLTYNSFHGDVSMGSAIQVSFNDNVSTNKIFKSMSLEGTQNIVNQPGVFVVNSDNLPDKQFSIGTVKDKGGILYFDIGQSQKNSSANVKCIGSITSIQAIVSNDDHPFNTAVSDQSDPEQYIDVKVNAFDLSASSLAQGIGEEYSGCLYFVKRITINDDGSQGQPEYVGDYAGIEDGFPGINDAKVAGSWGEISSYFTEIDETAYYPFDLQDPTIGIPNYYNGSKILKLRTPFSSGLENDNISVVWSEDVTTVDEEPVHNTTLGKSVYLLYQVSRNNVYGDDPRGQYCDLAVALGSEKFELYSLNLNYEPTNLDHSR